jgi:hypothetical protein
VGIEVTASGEDTIWKYRLELTQSNQRVPIVAKERVQRGTEILLDRPDSEDQSDPSRLTQTHLDVFNDQDLHV